MKSRSWPLLLLLALALAGCREDKKAAAAPQKPAAVDVAIPLKHKITEWEDFTGRFKAVQSVDVRARVTGYLLEKKFKDGQTVEKGDVLYVIDQRPFQYEVQRTQAQYEAAKRSYERADRLRDRQVVSEEEYDRRLQEMQSAEAALDVAKLNLGFTEVKAPISGKTSSDFINIGNLVRENETILTRIVSVDPIHFVCEASQGSLLKYTRLDREGKRPSSDRAPNPIFVKLLDETSYSHPGRMDFVDNVVDTGTGTIRGRALVENRKGLIYPGLFGRARVIGRSNFEAVMLPEKAINTDQDRKFVYIVNAENEVERRYIMPGSMLDNGFVVISDGLKGDERVVINGIQRIRAPKQKVTPVETPLEWTDLKDMPDPSKIPDLDTIRGNQNVEQNPPPSASNNDKRAEGAKQ